MGKQGFKSVYFMEDDLFGGYGRTVTIALSERDNELKTYLQHQSNEEIREAIGLKNYRELVTRAKSDNRSISQFIKLQLRENLEQKKHSFKSADVTFRNSKQLPFQRWYPYAEGYSPNFVKNLLEKYAPQARSVYDPFSGTGTTFFAADMLSIDSYYSEVNPLLVFLSEIKIKIMLLNQKDRLHLVEMLKDERKVILGALDTLEEDFRLKDNYSRIFGQSKYYDNETFSKILRLRAYIDKKSETTPLLAETLETAVLTILLKVSFLKKAGDVRFKTEAELKKEVYNIDNELVEKLDEMASDISNLNYNIQKRPTFLLYNAKKLNLLKDITFDCVITSPPYLNGTNYLRNTKIELWFLRCLQEEKDLRGLRDQIVTSGINDVKARNGESLKEVNKLNSKTLVKTLVELRERSYDKRIPLMIDSYFHEMCSVFSGVQKHLSDRGRVFIDIGDSIFAGVAVKTDEILVEVLENIGFRFIDKIELRKRRSRDKSILSQVLLVFEKRRLTKNEKEKPEIVLEVAKDWERFKETLPHQSLPFSKKNWGHPNHSLCSFGGKLKPSIAHFLVKTFVPEGGSVFDPFSGVGTIPFEAMLNNRIAFGMDISLPAFYISSAKVSKCDADLSFTYLDKMQNFISCGKIDEAELTTAQSFGFNRKIVEYFEEKTLREVLLARRFIHGNPPQNSSEMLVVASLLHVLHGNRPYALSRRSHPITPYAPTGRFEYRNLYEKVKNKLRKSLDVEFPIQSKDGKIYLHDATTIWPQAINNLNAVITSPPFFDSTRFYLANWMRLWMCGWNENDFKTKPKAYVEERQKISFDVYENIYRQARERLCPGGVLVFHLGKSKKCDMAEHILFTSKKYFTKHDLFSEDVGHCLSHGIRDKGSVTSHQYLILH